MLAVALRVSGGDQADRSVALLGGTRRFLWATGADAGSIEQQGIELAVNPTVAIAVAMGASCYDSPRKWV